jgi:hypothetical protein
MVQIKVIYCLSDKRKKYKTICNEKGLIVKYWLHKFHPNFVWILSIYFYIFLVGLQSMILQLCLLATANIPLKGVLLRWFIPSLFAWKDEYKITRYIFRVRVE